MSLPALPLFHRIAGQPVIAVDRQNRPVLKPAAPPAAAKAKE